jgi:ribosomal protein S19E (S16A)
MATRETVAVYGVKDVKSEAFVVEFAKYLKRSGKIELPKYVDFVKTGRAKELAPYNPDWFYIRAAALARRCYVRPGTGVGGFRKVFFDFFCLFFVFINVRCVGVQYLF